MRVLDIVTSILLDSSVAIEDLSTVPGRLWQYGDLQEIHDSHGILEVCWGRADDGATVYLFALWEDASFREDFHRQKRPTGMLDCYLRFPGDLRSMPCADDFSLSALTERAGPTALLTLCTRQKSKEDVGILAEDLESIWTDEKIVCAKVNDEACHHEGYNECSCNRGTRIMMIAKSSQNDAPDNSVVQKLLSTSSFTSTLHGFSHLHVHCVTLEPVKANFPPQAEPVAPASMSDLFRCNKIQFGQENPSYTPDLSQRIETIGRPKTDWAPPSVPNHPFRNGLARPAPSSTTGPTPPPSQPRHREAIRFTFFQERPHCTDSSASSAVDVAWLAFLSTLSVNLHSGSEKLYILSYPDSQALDLDLLIEYVKPSHAIRFQSDPSISASLSALRPHLAAEPLASPDTSVNLPLPLGGGSRVLEIIEFRFPSSTLTSLDRRAIEILFADFAATTNDGTMCVEEARQPVRLEREGKFWVEEGDWASYTRLFWWDGRREEKQWVRDFVAEGFEIAGRRAYALRLAAEVGGGEIRAVHIGFKEVDPWQFRDDGDDDMGF